MSALDNALKSLAMRENLSVDASKAAVAEILEGQATEAKIAAFLTGLRVKGETADELAGAVLAVRVAGETFALDPCSQVVLDTCGTGGDGACTLNISTATAIVVASCGVFVAKHGNRAASGNSGSAEVLVELGVDTEAPIDSLKRSFTELGITFLLAPRFHPGLKYAGPVRKQLPFRTLFNLVGPLANPARPSHQLIGVAGEAAADLVAETIAKLGTVRSAVITGFGGLDEVTLHGPTKVRWVESGSIALSEWNREDFGLMPVAIDQLRVTSPAESALRLRSILVGNEDPGRNMILANSAAALLVAGQVATLAQGVQVASRAIDSHRSIALLEKWSRMSL